MTGVLGMWMYYLDVYYSGLESAVGASIYRAHSGGSSYGYDKSSTLNHLWYLFYAVNHVYISSHWADLGLKNLFAVFDTYAEK